MAQRLELYRRVVPGGDHGIVTRWSKQLIARVTHVPTAIGLSYIDYGESERTFRDSTRGLKRACKWVDGMLDRGPRP